MVYTEIKPEDLVVGKEYALSRKGLQSRTSGAPTQSVLAKPETVVAPPTAKTTLENGLRALLTWKAKDGDSSERYEQWRRRGILITDMDIRKRGFFAGKNDKGGLVFTQIRSFGSTKPVKFVPVDVNEKWTPTTNVDDWAFWTESKNNSTRRNNTGLNRLAQMKELKARHPPNSNAWAKLNAEERNLIQKHLGGSKKSRRAKNRTY